MSLYTPVLLRKLVVLKTRRCFKYYKIILPAWAKNYANKSPSVGTANVKPVITAASSAAARASPQSLPVNDDCIGSKIQAKPTTLEYTVVPKAVLSVPANARTKDELSDILRTTGSLPVLFFYKHNQLVELQKETADFNNNVEFLTTSNNVMPTQASNDLVTAVEKIEKVDRNIQGKVILVDAVDPQRLQWHEQKLDLQRLPRYYMKLSKIRLTGLVVLTTLAGYIMAPSSLDPTSLLLVTVGTGLTSCAANAINQFLEVPYDSQMNRTKNRVLVRGYLTPLHAFLFAVITASCGIPILYFGLNGLTAGLGALNLLLYTCCYTPLKRCSILNTWVGSIVGAIPPMMGWAACSGGLEPGAWIMAIILYSWQFPHFNALSWNLRPDYSRAGYRMMSVTDPDLCRRTALRHSLIISACCLASPMFDVTTWAFAVDSLPLNSYLVFCAWKFYKEADSKSSRKLFRLSLVHLPALILLMFISKKYTVKSEDIDR